MLQQGVRALTSLYAELSQQLKQSVCPPFRIVPGLPSKTTLPAPLPSQEYIYLTVGIFFCTVVNWGSAERERGRERDFAEQEEILQAGSYFMDLPQSEWSSAALSGDALQTLKASVCICMWFGMGRFLIKVNAK